MESIIRSGKEYKNLAKQSKTAKKMIFYNENNDILIYQKDNYFCDFYVPTVSTSKEEDFFSEVGEVTGISFSIDSVDYFLQFLDYSFMLEKQNNKLKKNYLKQIRDYYSCFIDLKQDMIQGIAPVNKKGEIYHPKIMNLDEVVDIYSTVNHYSHTNDALIKFKQKVKGR